MIKALFSDVVKVFIVSSLCYLFLGISVGLTMMIVPAAQPDMGGWEYYLIPTHTHLMLIGWIAMVILEWDTAFCPRFSDGVCTRLSWRGSIGGVRTRG